MCDHCYFYFLHSPADFWAPLSFLPLAACDRDIYKENQNETQQHIAKLTLLQMS